MEKETKKSLCNKCEKNEAEEFHTCPYAEEINNDSEFTCDCCEGCQQQCADDI